MFETIEENSYLVYKKTDDNNSAEQSKFEVNTLRGYCSCLKPNSHGYPCKHLLKIIRSETCFIQF